MNKEASSPSNPSHHSLKQQQNENSNVENLFSVVSFNNGNKCNINNSANEDSNAEKLASTAVENGKGTKRKRKTSNAQRAKQMKTRMKELRLNELYVNKEKIKNKERKKENRKVIAHQEHEKKNNMERIKKRRKNEEYFEKEKTINKERIKVLRADENFSEKEKTRNKNRIENLRTNEDYSEKEKARNKERLENLRTNEDYSEKEKARNKERMGNLRTNEDYSEKEKARNKERMGNLRTNEEYSEKEKARNKERLENLRTNEDYSEKEKARNKERLGNLRTNEDYSEKEKARNKERMGNLRTNEDYSTREGTRNRGRIKELREDENFRDKENVRNKERIKELREDEDFSEKEKARNKDRIKRLREDEDFNETENSTNRASKDAQRKNAILRSRHNVYNTLLKQKTNIASLKLTFIRSRRDLPEYICCCCEGLFFEHSVINFNPDLIKSKIDTGNFDEFYQRIYNFPSKFVCKTCKKYIFKMQIPKLATSSGLKFVDIPECINHLSPLEERMCCPYIPFMQMRPLKSFAVNAQIGMKGSIVNIPIDVNECLHILPRNFDDSATVQVQLKRHLKHKSNYMFETVRPAVICDALKHLKTTPLYISNNIEIDENYLKRYDNQHSENIEFIVDANDKQEATNSHNLCESDSDEDDWEEVLLVDRNAVLKDDIEVIAPGQNKTPVPWHSIKNFDELCFPKIFCGHPLDIPNSISYSDRAKSECRRADRRSCVPNRLLFMAKQKIERQCTANINMCLRKTKLSSNIRAKNVLDQDFVNNLIKVDTGYQFTKEIRSSPAYWERKKKDLLAMIRQLGKPTLFLTLSAAENWWPELLSALSSLNLNQKITTLEALEMNHYEKTNLVKNDPVTCARYFNQKISNFMKLLKSEDSIFEEHRVEDSYQRVEFQMRGSPHEHMFLWLKGAPDYSASDPNSLQNVISFIERFITCENDENDPYIFLQKHKHTHTCYKGQKGKKKCRFHFPLPAMPRTMILTPLSKEESCDETKQNLKAINSLTEHFYRKSTNMSFEDILKKLNISEEEYILAVRSSIDQPRVFLKRSSLEVGINCYNKDILHLFESNMDIQLVLEEYGLASYIINYVSKVESGLSKLLRNAAKEVDAGNISLREKLRKIANVFLNSNLMSSQEAAYCLLSLPLSKSSRQVLFINTSPRQERVTMLKSKKDLQQLPPDSEDVYMEDIIRKYCRRPKLLEIACLAEFAAYHQKASKIYEVNEDEDDEETFMERGKAKVLRYRRYKLAQDAANYYREQLLLFLPFRDEISEIEVQNPHELYLNHLSTIKTNRSKFSKNWDDQLLEEAIESVQHNNYTREENEPGYDLHNPEDGDYKIDIFEQNGTDVGSKENLNRYTTPKRVSSEKLLQVLDSLNTRQKEFVKHILKNFKCGKTPFYIFLSGSAGVGKSTVVNAVYQAVTHHFDNLPGVDKEKIVVLLSAPSGKAAFLINGVTLHTAFALPVVQFSGNMPDLSSSVANSIREKLFNLKLLVIDEISMVGSRLLSRVDTRLRQIMGKSEPFGGVSVIAVGDLHQLPPVMDSPVYKFVPNEFSSLISRNPLWDEFKLFELTEVMRQKEDAKFIEILNEIAHGISTTSHVSLLNARVVKPQDVPTSAIRLFTTNKDVEQYNSFRIHQHSGECFISNAEDSVSGKSSDKSKSSIVNAIRKKKLSEVNGLPHTLELKVGLKYMVTSNINVQDGLVNGACGTLKGIYMKRGTEEPFRVFLDFGDDRVGCETRHQHRLFMERNNIDLHLTPIDMCRHLLNISNKLGVEVTRIQFPLICAEAITIHKSQGQTYNEVCLDINKCKPISKSMLYVALSRVTKLSGLYLLSPFKGLTPSKFPDPVLEEMTRLRNEKSVVTSE